MILAGFTIQSAAFDEEKVSDLSEHLLVDVLSTKLRINFTK
jgi:hypothetical protein